MTAIGIHGGAGRMGRAITDAIESAGATLAGGVDAGDDPSPLAAAADVLVDFSTPRRSRRISPPRARRAPRSSSARPA
ncbi:hypothetical protein [Sphingomonas aerolata]|uniref:hypothetical protein n=1 Tax=Sphingomonas aerolata TaxID=185951 RepID=UPI003A5B95D7